MTLIAPGSQEIIAEGPTTVADDPALTAELIANSWDTIVPAIGKRILSTQAELVAWERLPLWQKDGLRAVDPDFVARGSDIVQMVLTRVAELRQPQLAADEVSRQTETYYY